MNSSPQPKPLKRNLLAPHSADALWKCGFFRSSPYQSPAAARGVNLNDLLTASFSPGDKLVSIPPELREPFYWGVAKTLEFAKGHPPLVDRVQCQVEIPGINRPGYCDCIIPGALTSIDWKGGLRRSHARQMAFYALGQMTKQFAVQWTCAVLFLDEQETEFHRFTMEEAHQIVLESRMAYDAPDGPHINESCSWCANFYDCPRQLELAGRALKIGENALPWAEILNDPSQLSRFLLGISALKEFEKEGRLRAREFFFQKVEIPGFRLSNGKRSWSLPVESLLFVLGENPEALRAAIETYGAMSKEDYFKLCQKLKVEPDQTLLKVSKGEPFIVKK